PVRVGQRIRLLNALQPMLWLWPWISALMVLSSLCNVLVNSCRIAVSCCFFRSCVFALSRCFCSFNRFARLVVSAIKRPVQSPAAAAFRLRDSDVILSLTPNLKTKVFDVFLNVLTARYKPLYGSFSQNLIK